ncbi:hypothetical protein HanRHA438_Chr02g0089661 [Helianthus annuus]|nr:hypothetical protein HanRHA438_Chr02g0089661 [Helianthus annuus]
MELQFFGVFLFWKGRRWNWSSLCRVFLMFWDFFEWGFFMFCSVGHHNCILMEMEIDGDGGGD